MDLNDMEGQETHLPISIINVMKSRITATHIWILRVGRNSKSWTQEFTTSQACKMIIVAVLLLMSQTVICDVACFDS